ncbi:hypothetical protein [Paracoccus sp. (in: a-proteobacteria)]|uniref:hypothetical protein n=1 Tax=Paracoccus sp. TaxID=267 RepID=UPI003A8BFCC3
MRLILVVALLLSPLPLPAAAFIAQNDMRAGQVGPTEIAVEFRARRPDTDYWCAAGDYAQRVMDMPGKARIWRATPKPRKAGRGIVFTLDPAKKAEGAGLAQFGSGPRDGSISVAMAVGNFCRDFPPLWFD